MAASKLSAGGIDIDSTATGSAIAVTSVAIGKTYSITSVGSTNFIPLGATANTVGHLFVATAAGTGVVGGGTVTEVTQKIQVGSSASNHVRIDSGGITGVDTLLGTTFRLPTNGGRPTFSSGEITSTKFVVSTQGVIRTSETAGDGSVNGAGILINNVGIRGYAASQATISPNFQLDAGNGHITAKAGTVGGWTLSSTALIGGATTSTVGLEVDSTSGNVAIYAGGAAKASAPFRVTNTGVLTATGATINGAITATSFTLSGGIQIPVGGVSGLGALATKSSVDLTTAEVTNKSLANVDSAASTKLGTIATNADVTLSQINGGLSLTGGGLFVSSTAQIRTSNITWTQGTQIFTPNVNGFFLGDAKAINSTTTHRFFIGETGTTGTGGTNYLYWDGATLKIGGNIVGGTVVGAAGAGGGLIINSNIGIRTANSNQTLTITGGTANGNANGAQIDFSGNGLDDGSRGVLILQGGAVGTSLENGRIEFRTNTSSTSNVGVLRASIRTTGELIVYRNASWDGSSSVFTSGSGCGKFNGNLSVGMDFDPINSAGNTTGKLWVATEIAVYSSSARNIVLTGSSGDVTAIQFTTSSSKKVKTNIKKLNSGLEIIDKLRPVSFKRKDTKQEDIGLIAEEVDKILPVIVKHNDKNEAEGLDYSKLTVILINAVKELSAEVKKLKKKLKDADAN